MGDNNNSIHDGESGSNIIDCNLDRKIDSAQQQHQHQHQQLQSQQSQSQQSQSQSHSHSQQSQYSQQSQSQSQSQSYSSQSLKLLPPPPRQRQPKPLSYVLTIEEDLYQRILQEISDSHNSPCGLYHCCNASSEDGSHPHICIAVGILLVLFTGLFVATIIWPLD